MNIIGQLLCHPIRLKAETIRTLFLENIIFCFAEKNNRKNDNNTYPITEIDL